MSSIRALTAGDETSDCVRAGRRAPLGILEVAARLDLVTLGVEPVAPIELAVLFEGAVSEGGSDGDQSELDGGQR
ncbi:hypothetical protein AAFX91_40630 [Bradyrhizobium sp. 31Argb]|uniref:hypothetical protein n=1 Tax=unclassified Bradyrhizobium TaxID=2631580 RepID=UPI00102E6A1B|nr:MULTISPECIES: hypothetical protein [unclassified Bradyrhizobium]MDI4236984.1 hypothetical protein [Bradyrhizobium sp. Arg237L]TAI67701.1 hypothetical protein CWO89_01525 [Bradyrhizobium sp. Leo170]